MKDDVENNKPKISGFASIGIVEKCRDNALRLYNDALKTSPPTQAALLEIGIEELSKAMILFQNIPKDSPERRNFLNAMNEKNLLDLKALGNITGEDILAFHRSFEIGSKDLAKHKAKLQVIQNIFNTSAKVYLFSEKSLLSNSALIPPNVKSEDIIKKIHETFSKINDIKLENWDQVKERGFYVYPEEGRAPRDEQFDPKDLMMVFFVIYSTLKIFLSFSRGMKFKDFSYIDIFENFSDLLPPESLNKIKKMIEVSSLKDNAGQEEDKGPG